MSDEPVVTPPELWLHSSVGASFPDAVLGLAACSAGKEQAHGAGDEEGHAHLRTPWPNGQVDYTAYRLLDHSKEGDYAESYSAAGKEIQLVYLTAPVEASTSPSLPAIQKLNLG